MFRNVRVPQYWRFFLIFRRTEDKERFLQHLQEALGGPISFCLKVTKSQIAWLISFISELKGLKNAQPLRHLLSCHQKRWILLRLCWIYCKFHYLNFLFLVEFYFILASIFYNFLNFSGNLLCFCFLLFLILFLIQRKPLSPIFGYWCLLPAFSRDKERLSLPHSKMSNLRKPTIT